MLLRLDVQLQLLLGRDRLQRALIAFARVAVPGRGELVRRLGQRVEAQVADEALLLVLFQPLELFAPLFLQRHFRGHVLCVLVVLLLISRHVPDRDRAGLGTLWRRVC